MAFHLDHVVLLTAVEGVLDVVDGGVALLDGCALGHANRSQDGNCGAKDSR